MILSQKIGQKYKFSVHRKMIKLSIIRYTKKLIYKLNKQRATGKLKIFWFSYISCKNIMKIFQKNYVSYFMQTYRTKFDKFSLIIKINSSFWIRLDQ